MNSFFFHLQIYFKFGTLLNIIIIEPYREKSNQKMKSKLQIYIFLVIFAHIFSSKAHNFIWKYSDACTKIYKYIMRTQTYIYINACIPILDIYTYIYIIILLFIIMNIIIIFKAYNKKKNIL